MTIRNNKGYNKLESDDDYEIGLDNWNKDNNVGIGGGNGHSNLSSRIAGFPESGLNALENAVSQLKSVGYGIQSEIGTHINMLTEMNSNIDSANRRMKTAQRITNKLLSIASTTSLTVIAFLLFILLVLQLVF